MEEDPKKWTALISWEPALKLIWFSFKYNYRNLNGKKIKSLDICLINESWNFDWYKNFLGDLLLQDRHARSLDFLIHSLANYLLYECGKMWPSFLSLYVYMNCKEGNWFCSEIYIV